MNVLLTSVGRRSYLVRYFREALGGRGKVIAANMFANAPGMYEADKSVLVTASDDPTYVDAIVDLCRKWNVRLVCSMHDLDVFILGQQQHRIAETGAIPVLPNPLWSRLCLDKYECGLRLEECGWHVPWTGVTLTETRAALAAGRIRFPLIVKARLGFGSLGVSRCRDIEELEGAHQTLSTELAHSMLQRFHPLPLDQLVLVQEVLNGWECCLDIVNDLNGNYATHFACRVHAMRAGESDSVTTIDPPIFGDLPIKLSRMTRHPGIWGLDLMVHDDVATIIDINPRFTGDYPFHHIAGANIPAALIAWAEGETPRPEWLRPEVGVHGYKDLVPRQGPAPAT